MNKTRLPLSAIAMVFLAFAFLCFHGSVKNTQGMGDYSSGVANVTGFAWSSTFGWISMNCNNPGKFNTCASANYGVNINQTSESNPYNFSGHAWSPNAGWISFTYDSIRPPDNWRFNANCPATYTCNNTTNCTACYNPANGKIYGWARVVGLGNNGWIYLSATSSPVAIPGISIDQSNASGTFSGFGWNGNTDKTQGLGWVSFNCNNPGYFNTCGQASYFTYLLNHHLPTASNLNAPNWSYSNACTSSLALQEIFGWQNNSSQIAAYQVQVSANKNFSPVAYDSTKTAATNPTQFILNRGNFAGMAYNTAYYWQVRLWDDFGFVSNYRKFDYGHVAGDTLTLNAVGNGTTSITYTHEMPKVKFSYAPPLPLYNNPVTTTDASLSYTSGVAVSCWTAPRCTWLWSGNANMLTNSAPTASSTVMTFKYSKLSNPAQIFLTVTDSAGYSCSTGTPKFIVDLLPVWKETQAQ